MHRRLVLRILGLCLLPLTGSVAAQQLSVARVNIELPPGQLASSLSIRGSETVPTRFQVRAVEWTQRGDEELLNPTDQLLVSPPLGVIPPGKEQVVRVVLRRPVTDRERNFRVLVDQLPNPPAADAAANGTAAVAVTFRMSIPVFALPKAAQVAFAWSVERSGDAYYLVGENTGTRHQSFHRLEVRTVGGAVVPARMVGSPHVLVGTRRRWLLQWPDEKPAAQIAVAADSTLGPVQAVVRVPSTD